MFYSALLFLAIAMVTGSLGFSGLVLAAAGFSKLLFSLFFLGFLVALILALGRPQPPA